MSLLYRINTSDVFIHIAVMPYL